MDYKDYYKTLGVSKNADEKELKSAFRRLAQRYHPDKNPGDKQAEETFKEINEAYDVLSDPQKRQRYDQLGSNYANWERMGRPGGGFDFSQWASGMGGAGAGGGRGFSDFFETLFANMGAGGMGGNPLRQRGQDVEQTVDVSLEEVFNGGARTLQKGQRKLEVKIPKGARTGTKIRLGGEGGPGDPPGDLYLVVNVRDHATFRREGDDLHAEVPVDIFTAVTGGEVRVPTLQGSVWLNVPPETNSGKKFRLSGRGLPRLNAPTEHGDLYATVKLVLPTHLTDHERDTLRALAEQRAAHHPKPSA